MSENNLATDIRESASDLYDELVKDEEAVEETTEEIVDEKEEFVETEDVIDEPVEEEVEEEIESTETEEEIEPESSEEVVEEEIDATIVNAPTGWKADAKSKWAELPAWAKSEVVRRESDALTGVNQLKEKADFGDRLNKTIQPYQAFLTSKGINTESAVESALNLSYSLSTSSPQQRGMILRSLAEQYQADMSVMTQEIDPNQQQIMGLQQQIQTMQRSQQNNLQQSEQRQTQSTHDEINTFANETDENGALLHPYFQNVQGLMASLLENNQAAGISEAYELAVKAHPDTSALLQSDKTEKEEVKRQAVAKKRADKVKKANKVNLDVKPKSESSEKPKRSMRDTLNVTYDEIINR